MKHNKPVIYRCIHRMLVRRTTPDGKIERKKLFEIISERIGKIESFERDDVVRELESNGMILDSDRFSFTINRAV